LFSGFNVGPIDIVFGTPVFAAGAQIHRNYVGDFTSKIEAFDSASVSLGSFSLPGTSNSNADNSAIFLGVFDPLKRIASIEFSVDNNTAIHGFAINRMDLLVCPPRARHLAAVRPRFVETCRFESQKIIPDCPICI
jgi:hypothetical protein